MSIARCCRCAGPNSVTTPRQKHSGKSKRATKDSNRLRISRMIAKCAFQSLVTCRPPALCPVMYMYAGVQRRPGGSLSNGGTLVQNNILQSAHDPQSARPCRRRGRSSRSRFATFEVNVGRCEIPSLRQNHDATGPGRVSARGSWSAMEMPQQVARITAAGRCHPSLAHA